MIPIDLTDVTLAIEDTDEDDEGGEENEEDEKDGKDEEGEEDNDNSYLVIMSHQCGGFPYLMIKVIL